MFLLECYDVGGDSESSSVLLTDSISVSNHSSYIVYFFYEILTVSKNIDKDKMILVLSLSFLIFEYILLNG